MNDTLTFVAPFQLRQFFSAPHPGSIRGILENHAVGSVDVLRNHATAFWPEFGPDDQLVVQHAETIVNDHYRFGFLTESQRKNGLVNDATDGEIGLRINEAPLLATGFL
jgi:hypothetical protein